MSISSNSEIPAPGGWDCPRAQDSAEQSRGGAETAPGPGGGMRWRGDRPNVLPSPAGEPICLNQCPWPIKSGTLLVQSRLGPFSNLPKLFNVQPELGITDSRERRGDPGD